ncbi:MAG TPA: hypothetical protein ENJ82_15580 [Bacteroidetes bacterium]|nr:hypothetical protein [Bacteroidota bacterium]
MVGAEAHFRMYAPGRYFKFDRGEVRRQRRYFFDGLVGSTWGLLALISCDGYVPLRKNDEERNLLFFRRLVEDWEIILNERHLFERKESAEFFGKYFWCGAESMLLPAVFEAGVPGGHGCNPPY